MRTSRFFSVACAAVLTMLVCSCTGPGTPATPAANQPQRPGMPQYTMGHWSIVMIDQQVHLSLAQKERMARLDEQVTARVRDIQAKTYRDVLAEMEPSQREQFCKKYGDAIKNSYWYPNAFMVQVIDREVDLAGFQKQRMTAVIERGSKEIQQRQTEFNDALVSELTPEQKADYTRKQVYSGVWNRIACVHPTKEQQAKFESVLEQTIKGVNLSCQKTRDELTLKIYYIVRDTVLTEQQLSFFKCYPQAFYPDKPGMKPVYPSQTAAAPQPNPQPNPKPQPPVTGPRPPVVPQKPNAMDPYAPGGPLVNWIDRDVKLSDEQKKQMCKLAGEFAEKTKNFPANLSEDMLTVLTHEQKEKFNKSYPKGIPPYIGGMFLVGWLNQQVCLTAEQQEKAKKVQDRYAAKYQDMSADFHNSLMIVLTKEQRDKWTTARLHQSVWDRIACVHPTNDQIAKFEAYMKEQAIGVNLADQKARDALGTKVYIYVRDHILTEGQLGFFKLYPHAFYPDRPEMQKPSPKATTCPKK